MSYKYETQHNSPNFTRGADAQRTWGQPFAVRAIAIHWWGDPNTNPTYEGVINTLVNPNRGASAHFVATGTGRRVAQLINLDNASWATNSANPWTISIECDPRCRPEDYDVVAELIAQIRQVFGSDLPLVPHRQFVATQCPGNYDLAHLNNLAKDKVAKPEFDWGHVENKVVAPPAPVSQNVPAAVKLDKVIKFTAKLDKTEVWDLTTNPNYKSTKTLTKGAPFDAFAKIDFNGTSYYVTEYSFGKGWKHGVNKNDLDEVKPPVVVPPVNPPVETSPDPTEEPPKSSEPETGTTDPTKPKTVSEALKNAFAKFIELLKEFWNS